MVLWRQTQRWRRPSRSPVRSGRECSGANRVHGLSPCLYNACFRFGLPLSVKSAAQKCPGFRGLILYIGTRRVICASARPGIRRATQTRRVKVRTGTAHVRGRALLVRICVCAVRRKAARGFPYGRAGTSLCILAFRHPNGLTPPPCLFASLRQPCRRICGFALPVTTHARCCCRPPRDPSGRSLALAQVL